MLQFTLLLVESSSRASCSGGNLIATLSQVYFLLLQENQQNYKKGRQEKPTSSIFSESRRQQTLENPKFFVWAKANKSHKICLESYSSMLGKGREDRWARGDGSQQRPTNTNSQKGKPLLKQKVLISNGVHKVLKVPRGPGSDRSKIAPSFRRERDTLKHEAWVVGSSVQ